MGAMKRAAAERQSKKITKNMTFTLKAVDGGKKSEKPAEKPEKSTKKPKGQQKPKPAAKPKKPAKVKQWVSITGQKDISSNEVAISNLVSDLSTEINGLSRDIMSIRVKRGKLFAKIFDAFGGKFEPFWNAIEGKSLIWHVTKGNVKKEISLWKFCESFPATDKAVMECVTYAVLEYFKNSFSDSEFKDAIEGLRKRKDKLEASLKAEDETKRDALIMKEIKKLAAAYKKRHKNKADKEAAKEAEKRAETDPELQIEDGDEEEDVEEDVTDGMALESLSGTPAPEYDNSAAELTHSNMIRLCKNMTTYLKNYYEMAVGRNYGICSLSELDFTWQTICDLDTEVRGIMDRLKRAIDARDGQKRREKAQRTLR